MASEPNYETYTWRTRWEPLEDITAYEIALDMKYVNASQVVSSWHCDGLGSALRHRVCSEGKERMDKVWQRFKASREAVR